MICYNRECYNRECYNRECYNREVGTRASSPEPIATAEHLDAPG